MNCRNTNMSRIWLATCLFAALSMTGCWQKMAVQPKVKAQQANSFFADGRGSRPFEIGVVAQGEDFLQEDGHLYTGKVEGAPTLDSTKPETVAAQYHDTFPAKLTIDEGFLKRGQERYNIYCAVCHGQTGNADGTIVQRGFLRPPAFYPTTIAKGRDGEPNGFAAEHNSRGMNYLGVKGVPLWKVPVGYIYSVITNGYGAMGSYSAQITPADRWAIVAYVRALQYSQSDKARSDLDAAKVAVASPEKPESGKPNTELTASTTPVSARKDGSK
jgi:mono/diheme cytochrome c family protein